MVIELSVLLMLAAGQTPAQTPTGAITGTVRDASGGVIPGATIVVTAVAPTVLGGRGGGPVSTAIDPVTQRAVTSVSGSYTIGNLPPGLYELSVSLAAFKTARHRFTIIANQAVNTEIRLELGGLHESVLVRSPTSTQPLSARRPWPSTPADYFDAARMYYDQGRIADAEAMTTRALELLRRSLSEVPAAPAPTPSDGRVRVGGNIQSPQRLSGEPPVYPADAAAAGIEGVVIIEAIVGKDGAVTGAKVLRSVRGLDQAALDAVQKWRFTPTLLNKQPVEVVMTVDLTFVAK